MNSPRSPILGKPPPGRLAGISAKLTVHPEEATYFDRKEKRKKTSPIWALSLEVERQDMRKLISNLTENDRLFAEIRKLLSSCGKVIEVVEDEREQAPDVAVEFYSPSVNGSPATETTEGTSPTGTTFESVPPNSPSETQPHGNGFRASGGNGLVKPLASGRPPRVPPAMATCQPQFWVSISSVTNS